LDADDSRGASGARAPAESGALQILTAEHASLSSARSLAYNEAFTRGNMFLGFLSMSLVALALIAQASPGRDFLAITAIVLTFDLVVGLTTFGRILAAGYEDYVVVHGMARIRHAYLELAPSVRPYVTSSTHDDLPGVMLAYGNPPTRGVAAVIYGLTTSSGMIMLVLSMLAAVLAVVVAMLAGGSVEVVLAAAGVAFVVMLAVLGASTYRYYSRKQAIISVLFPTPPEEAKQPGTRAVD
jgi:hypothetical protein